MSATPQISRIPKAPGKAPATLIRDANGTHHILAHLGSSRELFDLAQVDRTRLGSWQRGGCSDDDGTSTRELLDAIEKAQPFPTARAAYERARETLDAKIDRSKLQPVRRRRRCSDEGDEVNIDRFLQGRDDCWERVTKSRKRRLITLGIQYAVSCGNGVQRFAENCANAAALCETLEGLGYVVRIIGLISGSNPAGLPRVNGENVRGECGVTWTMKEHGERLDVNAIMAHGHPAYLRTLALSGRKGGRGTSLFHLMPCQVDPDDFNVLCTEMAHAPMAALGIDAIVGTSWNLAKGTQNAILSEIADHLGTHTTTTRPLRDSN